MIKISPFPPSGYNSSRSKRTNEASLPSYGQKQTSLDARIKAKLKQFSHYSKNKLMLKKYNRLREDKEVGRFMETLHMGKGTRTPVSGFRQMDMKNSSVEIRNKLMPSGGSTDIFEGFRIKNQ
jgi:hypothetical protein